MTLVLVVDLGEEGQGLLRVGVRLGKWIGCEWEAWLCEWWDEQWGVGVAESFGYWVMNGRNAVHLEQCAE